MRITQSSFVCSSSCYEQCPQDKKPEIALIGRSNVGKSSLINMILGRNNLVNVSKTPGKTQSINHFLVNDFWHFVDLPGYGWAKVSKSQKIAWKKMIRDYLLNREQLVCVFSLIDSRLSPQKIDLDFIHWLGINKIPFSIIFTKVDKLSKDVATKNIGEFKRVMLESDWKVLPNTIVSSAKSDLGKMEILEYINRIIVNI